MECNDGSDQGTEIDDQQLVVCLDRKALDSVGVLEVGQAVENILQVVDDLMVDW